MRLKLRNGIGLIGAALLAASILPLSTAYAASDLTGQPAGLNDKFREAPLFYGTFGAVIVLSAGLVLLPGAPLISILVLTQVLNAILLLPLLFYMYGIARDRRLMGEYVSSRAILNVYLVVIAFVALAIAAMLWYSFR